MGTLRTIGTEVAALGTLALSLPLRLVLPRQRFDAAAPHPTPVVLVHGLLGDPTNFLVLQHFLSARGVRNFASFSYAPRIDYQRLAPHLLRTIEAVCRETGSPQVDVVGHSLGGLLARYLLETDGGGLMRRLVTLGSPYFTERLPRQELAFYAAHDPLVPAPGSMHAATGRVVVIPDCGHWGLLFHSAVLRRIAGFLTTVPVQRPVRHRPLAARQAA